MNEKRTVAMLGLGTMGAELAHALLRAGLDLVVWNRTAQRCGTFAAAGARVSASAAAACEAAGVVVVCVTGQDALAAILDSDGVAGALHGRTIVQLSTVTPPEARALHEWLGAQDAACLDAAILGYPADVRAGTARIAFSGARAVFDANRHVVDALSGDPMLVAETPGTAFLADKIVYAQFYGIALAWLHTAALAAAAGIALPDLRALVSGEERWLWKGRTMDGFLDRVERGDYGEAGCSLRTHAAAYDQIVRLGAELGVDRALPAAIADAMARAIARGHGADELAAVFEVLVPRRPSAAASDRSR